MCIVGKDLTLVLSVHICNINAIDGPPLVSPFGFDVVLGILVLLQVLELVMFLGILHFLLELNQSLGKWFGSILNKPFSDLVRRRQFEVEVLSSNLFVLFHFQLPIVFFLFRIVESTVNLIICMLFTIMI
jgi:hypothetical protein